MDDSSCSSTDSQESSNQTPLDVTRPSKKGKSLVGLRGSRFKKTKSGVLGGDELTEKRTEDTVASGVSGTFTVLMVVDSVKPFIFTCPELQIQIFATVLFSLYSLLRQDETVNETVLKFSFY